MILSEDKIIEHADNISAAQTEMLSAIAKFDLLCRKAKHDGIEIETDTKKVRYVFPVTRLVYSPNVEVVIDK